jgi:hypothetical protein
MRNRYLILGLAAFLALALSVPALGGPSNPLAHTAASVKSTANKALKKAKTAQSAADAAQSTASSASSTANSALTKANSLDATKYDSLFTRTGPSNAASDADKAQLDISPCLAGEDLVSAGWSLTGAGTDDAIINISIPYGSADWVIQADDRNTLAGAWGVSTFAQCISP